VNHISFHHTFHVILVCFSVKIADISSLVQNHSTYTTVGKVGLQMSLYKHEQILQLSIFISLWLLLFQIYQLEATGMVWWKW